MSEANQERRGYERRRVLAFKYKAVMTTTLVPTHKASGTLGDGPDQFPDNAINTITTPEAWPKFIYSV